MKKNRKFIKKIIFSILLLLCVCVPFLVHKNNVKAQTEITNLTNTYWQFNNSLTSLMTPGLVGDIGLGEYIAGGDKNYRYIAGTDIETLTDNSRIVFFSSSSTSIVTRFPYVDWVNDNQIYWRFHGLEDTIIYLQNPIFHITGGTDVTNTNVIAWIQENATLVSGWTPEEPEPDPVYTISGQYRFNDEITWLYDINEQEGVLYLPFYVYNLDNSSRVNYDYMINKYNEVDGFNDFMYVNETASGTFTGQVAGYFTTNTTIRISKPIVYFYTAEVSELVYNWLNENGEFINDPILDPNNPENPDSDNNPNNPNNPDFGTDTVRQIVNQVNTFLGIQILPGLSFRDILLICIALPLLIYILKVFLGG